MLYSSGLGTRLRTLLALLDGDVEAIYRELNADFRPRFYPIAAFLLHKGACQIGDLAAAIGVSQPAVTQTVREMARLGLVDVEVGKDRRSRDVSLSHVGLETVRSLGPAWEAIQVAADELDDEMQVPLTAVLDEAIAALRSRRFADRIRGQMEGD
jgi:MarR family transcriptional regulator, organic hydroperoxide resistance regulator